MSLLCGVVDSGGLQLSGEELVALVAGWTGVDVLESVRARFGSAGLVNGDGEPLDVAKPPAWAPIVLVVAEKR